MAKKMKANDIKNIAKKEFACKKVIVTAIDGTEFEIQIQEKLNETSIMNLIAELIERSNFCTENNISFDELLNIYYLLFKYFTDIYFGKYESTKKQYEEDLTTVKNMYDLGLFEQILNHFNEETMTKIQNSLEKYSKQLKIVTNNKLKEMIDKEIKIEKESDDNAII